MLLLDLLSPRLIVHFVVRVFSYSFGIRSGKRSLEGGKLPCARIKNG
jgi:hypothetical protein